MEQKKIKQVTVEFFPRDMRGVGYHDLIDGIERVTVLTPISLMPEKSALLTIIKWVGSEDMERWKDYPLIEQVIALGEVKGGKMYLILGKEEPWFFGMIKMIMEEMKVFFNWPVIMEPERIEIKWIGYLQDISRVMDLFKKFNMEERITSIINYDPSLPRALEALTDRQYSFLLQAYEKGYFNDHRGITLKDLAKENEVSAASYMITMRRGLRKLIEGALEER